MRKLLNLILLFVRGKQRPLPHQHGPAFQAKLQQEQKKKLTPANHPRDEYGRWIEPDEFSE
jgi:hypothetical protein